MNPESAPAIPAAEALPAPMALPAHPSETQTAHGLLETLLEAGPATGGPDLRLERFLRESSPVRALCHWLGAAFPVAEPDCRRCIANKLSQDIAQIDNLLDRQVNAILHHPRLQKLEASWRGLHYLVHQVPADGQGIVIKLLNLPWAELVRDLDRAMEFDQSQLFRKVYEDQFGMAGGEPFGLLIGDYEIHLRPGPNHPTDDLAALGSIAAVAAAAFAPFVAAAHASLLDLTSFSGLERSLDLGRTFKQVEFLKWNSLRQGEDSRFVGLTLPRILMRLPYQDESGRVDGFRFHEDVGAPDRGGYLWGNAAYAFGAVVVRAFATSGWLAGIRGVRRGEDTGGVVSGLPVHSFGTDRVGLVPKTSSEVMITDMQDKELGDHGFLALCACPDTQLSAFYGCQSIQKPKVFDEQTATANARLSAAIHYMLCVSRFAHYLKVMARDKVGSFQAPADLEDYLRKWLTGYVNSNENAAWEVKARYPLRESRVQVREVPGRPGKYACEIHLRPHFQLDQMVSTVRLRTTLSASQPN
jgi:type VI secretion system ImpC/EvpB family protein